MSHVLRPLCLVELCHLWFVYSKPATWVALCRSNLPLICHCVVHSTTCFVGFHIEHIMWKYFSASLKVYSFDTTLEVIITGQFLGICCVMRKRMMTKESNQAGRSKLMNDEETTVINRQVGCNVIK